MNLTGNGRTFRNKGLGVITLVGIIFFSSCITQRRVEYMQQMNLEKAYPTSFTEHVLKPLDELFIQISSMSDDTPGIFPNNNSGAVASTSATGVSLVSYTIDVDGFIEIPLLGKVYAKDKTIAELKILIKDSLINILSQPIVEIRLVNQFFAVVGEVNSPGHYVFNQDKLSIFDAFSMAGDLLPFANRKNIILVRNENNVNKIIEINLLHADVLKSEDYYIRSGDILYVKPLRRKNWGVDQITLPFMISMAATIYVITTYTNR